MNQQAYNQAYYLANRQKLLARSTAYQASNRKRHQVIASMWRSSNPEYVALENARQRCFNSKRPGYENYGGRGIVCRLTYKELLTAIGRRPSKNYSLDRINNDGHYEIGNIRWATRKQQNANRR